MIEENLQAFGHIDFSIIEIRSNGKSTSCELMMPTEKDTRRRIYWLTDIHAQFRVFFDWVHIRYMYMSSKLMITSML